MQLCAGLWASNLEQARGGASDGHRVGLVELVGVRAAGPAMAMVELSHGRTGGWVEVLLARLSDVSAVRQLRLSVDAKPVSLGEPLLTAPDAAALLSVRPSWIYEAVRDGRLPCVRVGRHVRFLRSDLEEWVRAQRAPGRP